MKKIQILLLLILVILPSACKKEEYKILLDKDGNKITQLMYVDKNNKNAYLRFFSHINEDYLYEISEEIAKSYNIEGYNMLFFDSLRASLAENNWEDAYPETHITPFQYRKFYIENNDTIAKALNRTYYSGKTAHLITNKRYSPKDSLILKRCIDSLGLYEAFFYDSIPQKTISCKEERVFCYSYYLWNNKLFFWDNIDTEDEFVIDDIRFEKYKDTNLSVSFVTNKYLTKEQILKVNEREYLHNKILYFYHPSDFKKDYASIIYNKTRKEYNIFMFNEKRTYTYNIEKNSWSFYNH